MVEFQAVWSKAKTTWIFSYYDADNKRQQKWMPKSLKALAGHAQPNAKDQLSAEKWFRGWYAKEVSHEQTPADASKLTLAVLVPRFLQLRAKDPNIKPRTYAGDVKNCNRWVLDCPGNPHHSIQNLDVISELRAVDIQTWVRSLRGEEASKQAYISTLRALFALFISREDLPETFNNPMNRPLVVAEEKILRAEQTRKREQTPISHLTKEEVAKLFECGDENFQAYRRVLYSIAIMTGLRYGEIAGLTWSDWREDYLHVDKQLLQAGPKPVVSYEDFLKKGQEKSELKNITTAIISLPKKKRIRDVPLHPLAIQVLDWWWRIGWRLHVGRAPSPSDPIFARGDLRLRDGQTSGSFSLMETSTFAVDLARAGVLRRNESGSVINDRGLSFHSMRHTFATLLDQAEISEGHQDSLLGHARGSVRAKHYAEITLDEKRADVKKLPFKKLRISEELVIANR